MAQRHDADLDHRVIWRLPHATSSCRNTRCGTVTSQFAQTSLHVHNVVAIHVLEQTIPLCHRELAVIPAVGFPVHVQLQVIPGVDTQELIQVAHVLPIPPLNGPQLRVIGPVAIVAVSAQHFRLVAAGPHILRPSLLGIFHPVVSVAAQVGLSTTPRIIFVTVEEAQRPVRPPSVPPGTVSDHVCPALSNQVNASLQLLKYARGRFNQLEIAFQEQEEWVSGRLRQRDHASSYALVCSVTQQLDLTRILCTVLVGHCIRGIIAVVDVNNESARWKQGRKCIRMKNQ